MVPLFVIFYGGQFCEPFELSMGSGPGVECSPVGRENALTFMKDLKLCTWNAQGLFGARLARARHKSRFLLRLAASTDILVVQEAHCCRCYSSWGR